MMDTLDAILSSIWTLGYIGLCIVFLIALCKAASKRAPEPDVTEAMLREHGLTDEQIEQCEKMARETWRRR